MSEETSKELERTLNPTITAPTITKVKDPRRVAQGKKLAEISKAAKAAKKKRLQEAAAEKTPAHEGGAADYLSYSTVFGAIGVIVGIGGLYFSYKGSIMEWKQKTVKVNESENVLLEDSKQVVEPNGGFIALEGFD